MMVSERDCRARVDWVPGLLTPAVSLVCSGATQACAVPARTPAAGPDPRAFAAPGRESHPGASGSGTAAVPTLQQGRQQEHLSGLTPAIPDQVPPLSRPARGCLAPVRMLAQQES